MKYLLFVLTAMVGLSTPAYSQNWNFDISIGAVDAGDLLWAGGSFDTDRGQIFTLGVSTELAMAPGLEVGFELGRSTVEYSCCAPNDISGTHAFVTGKYNFFQSNGFEGYAGLGLGIIDVAYEDVGFYTASDKVAGGALSLGVRYAVSSNLELTAEVRRTDTFEDPIVAIFPGTQPAEFNHTSLLIGMRTSF